LRSSSGFDGSVDVADDGGRGFRTSGLETAVESFRVELRGEKVRAGKKKIRTVGERTRGRRGRRELARLIIKRAI